MQICYKVKYNKTNHQTFSQKAYLDQHVVIVHTKFIMEENLQCKNCDELVVLKALKENIESKITELESHHF